MGANSLRLLNQSTHSSVANSTALHLHEKTLTLQRLTAACRMIRARTLLNRFEKLDIPPPPGKALFVFDLSRFTRDELKPALIAVRDGHTTEEDHTSVSSFMAMSRGHRDLLIAGWRFIAARPIMKLWTNLAAQPSAMLWVKLWVLI